MGVSLKINKKIIGDGHPTYIIAEMSANHGGDFDQAVKIVESAAKIGADCIKVQTYTPDTITLNVNSPLFQIENGTWAGESLYQLYQQAMTPWEWQPKLKKIADNLGIDFLATPFDFTAVDFLESLHVNCYKIASFEIVDIPLIEYVAKQGKPIIMSTGMANIEEIEEAVKVIKKNNNDQIALLKCSSSYPAIPEEMNLRTIPHLKSTFNVPAGLSDHSLGSLSAILAIALGANIIEKHFCLSRDIKTPDSSFSLEPAEFQKMIEDIRIAEQALGDIHYKPTEKEVYNLRFRKSLFISEDMKRGDVFTSKNLRIVRPGMGLHPRYYFEILGRKAKSHIVKGTPFTWDLID